MKKFLIAVTLFLVFAGSVVASERVVWKAEVIEILDEGEQVILDDYTTFTQEVLLRLENGPRSGEEVKISNDYTPLREGDKIYVAEIFESGEYSYHLFEINRTPVLLLLLFVFVLLVFIFGGWQGLRGLVSLAGSLILIAFVLLPGILKGYSPILVSICVASVIIVFGSYITHGFNRTTTSAVFGMLITVLLSGLIAHFAVDATRLSGLADEESLYLSMNVGQSIDVLGLLFGGIIIGLLGVLYDTAISQSIAVEELVRISPDSTKTHIYKRALRIGREHIGALVDTLAIAYIGASLPLFLLFYSDQSVAHSISINNEVFVAEIIRTLVGSIGIVLAVPITTFLAVQMLYGRKFEHESHGHSHSHTH